MNPPLATLLALASLSSLAHADDTQAILDDGAATERAHAIENATAAGVSAAVLGYESFELLRMAIETEPSGGLVDLSALGKGVGYTLGTITGLGAITMVGLGIYDVVAAPVADARDARRRDPDFAVDLADRELSKRWRDLRLTTWFNLTLGAGLTAWGGIEAARDRKDASALLWIGGTDVLVAATVLLHLREPVAVRTHRRLALRVTPRGMTVAGTF